ncbi:GNAT family N-acetyltransferase [Planotetraspora thailandica]|uniref:GNAT family N-acetyltransferase n=1 Tax=Planotetraspora thailandica TaxID=487172 RepID=A0A8J3XVR1_9ACTN|nr:GNAT family N-acetyltransferase [Planotetraspora thailandica]GII53961.1 GNAT family N-acetyltransferase [Planotetraspora thailandica]
MSPVSVEPLLAAANADAALVERLTTLVNEVYAVAEKGLWADGYARTTPGEIAALVGAGEIAVARVDGRIVGCVRVQDLDEHTGEFGMLAADLDHRGAGVGRALVAFAEGRSRDLGRRTMQLELLVPRGWAHPSKEFLAGWYGRLGYRRVDVGAIEEAHPTLAPLLATPCDYLVYRKDLGA